MSMRSRSFEGTATVFQHLREYWVPQPERGSQRPTLRRAAAIGVVEALEARTLMADLTSPETRSAAAQEPYLTGPVSVAGRPLNVAENRSNAHQTGTLRMQVYPPVACHDIEVVYANSYNIVMPGGQIVPNTNDIAVKSSILVNGMSYPAYFSGVRTATVVGGGSVTGTAFVSVTPTDKVYVVTYFDVGSGGYLPTGMKLAGDWMGQGSDAEAWGVDLTDSGAASMTPISVTDSQWGPAAVLATPDGAMPRSVLILGDSIAVGVGDEPLFQSNGAYMGGWQKSLAANGIPFETFACGGETAQFCASALYLRGFLAKGASDVICTYGINDVSVGRTLPQIEADLLTIWRYFGTEGRQVWQGTILPKTTSTDLWLTADNQTVYSYEPVRLALNAWLRDTSSAGAVAQSGVGLRIIDWAAPNEVNGKWVTYPTPILTGRATAVGTNYLTDSAATMAAPYTWDNDCVLTITGGTGAGQSHRLRYNFADNRLYATEDFSPAIDTTSTYSLYRVASQDGTHPSPSSHALMAAALPIDEWKRVDVAPQVTSLVINDGAVQRSMVTKLVATFSAPVTIADGAISLLTRRGNAVSNLTINKANPLGDQMTWELTFSGLAIQNGSLPDGTYKLVISAAGVTDLSGTPMADDYTGRFYRLFGDSDGDRVVSRSDLVAMRSAMNQPATAASWLDYDGNGLIDANDLRQLRVRVRRAVL